MHLVALRGRDLAEKRRFRQGAAIQFDERVAHRVAPVLKPLSLGNGRGCQNDLHRSPRKPARAGS
jgi:hypothetical protein